MVPSRLKNMNKSTFQNISLKQIAESKTNPRGTSFEGPEFNDLVASIKEKGINVPLILRPIGKGYEIVAGSRRFRAAQKLKLTQVPTNIQELTDAEAQEVQIIENLQRANVHPLDEGQAYRKLIEQSNYEVPSVAAKVGKSEAYVYQRLFLTNLIDGVAKAYRAGVLPDGHVVLIAKLTPSGQEQALKYYKDETEYGEQLTLKDLKEWIEREFYHPLAFQPWLKNKAAADAVGPCKECPPNVATLFGDVKTGQCTDLKCWARKMQLYIKWRMAADKELEPISKEYRTQIPGVYSKTEYVGLSTKAKDHCQHAKRAIVMEGTDLGTEMWICASKECKKHASERSSSGYEATPAEKAARKRALAAKIAKEAREATEVANAVKKIKLPLGPKAINALMEIAIREVRDDGIRLLIKGKDWEVLRVKTNYSPKPQLSYTATLRAKVKAMKDEEKIRVIFEAFLLGHYDRAKIMKML
jgi:ParB family chromosome partitioning protein